MASFARYIGIDYSGAETPTARLKGLEVYVSAPGKGPERVTTLAGQGWKWNRKEIAHWLAEQLETGEPIIVGIDHAFSFPRPYFARHELLDWDSFLTDFCKHWPADEDNTYLDFLREGNERTGTSDEFRLTEKWTSSAKSVFAFGGPGQVAPATHAGIPWLRFLRKRLGKRVHFWPFDGFEVPAGRSVLAEVYPAILKSRYPSDDRSSHQQDAYAVARWMKETDEQGFLPRYFTPPLTDKEQDIVQLEGWILGVA